MKYRYRYRTPNYWHRIWRINVGKANSTVCLSTGNSNHYWTAGFLLYQPDSCSYSDWSLCPSTLLNESTPLSGSMCTGREGGGSRSVCVWVSERQREEEHFYLYKIQNRSILVHNEPTSHQHFFALTNGTIRSVTLTFGRHNLISSSSSQKTTTYHPKHSSGESLHWSETFHMRRPKISTKRMLGKKMWKTHWQSLGLTGNISEVLLQHRDTKYFQAAVMPHSRRWTPGK